MTLKRSGKPGYLDGEPVLAGSITDEYPLLVIVILCSLTIRGGWKIKHYVMQYACNMHANLEWNFGSMQLCAVVMADCPEYSEAN